MSDVLLALAIVAALPIASMPVAAIRSRSGEPPWYRKWPRSLRILGISMAVIHLLAVWYDAVNARFVSALALFFYLIATIVYETTARRAASAREPEGKASPLT